MRKHAFTGQNPQHMEVCYQWAMLTPHDYSKVSPSTDYTLKNVQHVDVNVVDAAFFMTPFKLRGVLQQFFYKSVLPM